MALLICSNPLKNNWRHLKELVDLTDYDYVDMLTFERRGLALSPMKTLVELTIKHKICHLTFSFKSSHIKTTLYHYNSVQGHI